MNKTRYRFEWDEIEEGKVGLVEDPEGPFIIIKSYKNNLPVIKKVC